MNFDTTHPPATKLSDILGGTEIRPFTQRSDARAWLMVVINLAIIGFAFALPILWLNPFTVVLCMLLLGARQLGMAVIYHDCSHAVFFSTRWLNDLIGHWVAGALLNTSMYAYRAYHLNHHRFAGTTDDPDLAMAQAYPATRSSLKRKLVRDVTGQTGIKAVRGQLSRFGLKRNAPFVIVHLALFGVLWAAGAPWAYLLWWAAYLFVHQIVTRLRFIGEHGVALDRLSPDARENTCTTLVSWWERLLVAPNYVNFHLEHHLSAAVPCYRLAGLHKVLVERGFFTGINCLSSGYLDVLRKAVVPEAGDQLPASA